MMFDLDPTGRSSREAPLDSSAPWALTRRDRVHEKKDPGRVRPALGGDALGARVELSDYWASGEAAHFTERFGSTAAGMCKRCVIHD